MPRTDLTAPNGAKFHVGQTAAEIVALRQAARETDPGILVELGTWRAGATYVLRRACPSVPLVSFDVACPLLTPEQYLAIEPHTLLLEADVFADPLRVVQLWRGRPWPAFLYCDDGDKPREVQTFAPWLRPGDVIGCHDWGKEIGPADVQSVLPPTEWEPFCTGSTEGTTCRFWRRLP